MHTNFGSTNSTQPANTSEGPNCHIDMKFKDSRCKTYTTVKKTWQWRQSTIIHNLHLRNFDIVSQERKMRKHGNEVLIYIHKNMSYKLLNALSACDKEKEVLRGHLNDSLTELKPVWDFSPVKLFLICMTKVSTGGPTLLKNLLLGMLNKNIPFSNFVYKHC